MNAYLSEKGLNNYLFSRIFITEAKSLK